MNFFSKTVKFLKYFHLVLKYFNITVYGVYKPHLSGQEITEKSAEYSDLDENNLRFDYLIQNYQSR